MKFKNTETMPIVFTAQSKQFFYCKDVICAWVLGQGRLPLNPFRVFDYFLGERVERNLIRQGNNNLLRIADELWVFGIVADGVLFEIEYALELQKPVKFFTIGTRLEEISEVPNLEDVRFEPEIHSTRRTRSELLAAIGAQSLYAQLDLFRLLPGQETKPGSFTKDAPGQDSSDFQVGLLTDEEGTYAEGADSIDDAVVGIKGTQ